MVVGAGTVVPGKVGGGLLGWIGNFYHIIVHFN